MTTTTRNTDQFGIRAQELDALQATATAVSFAAAGSAQTAGDLARTAVLGLVGQLIVELVRIDLELVAEVARIEQKAQGDGAALAAARGVGNLPSPARNPRREALLNDARATALYGWFTEAIRPGRSLVISRVAEARARLASLTTTIGGMAPGAARTAAETGKTTLEGVFASITSGAESDGEISELRLFPRGAALADVGIRP